MTLQDLFPGKMGKVELTRIAIRLRMPHLLRSAPDAPLDAALAATLQSALDEVRKG
jgi:hypothetical protein